MNANRKIAAATTAGALVGIVVAQALPAQHLRANPAYIIAEVEKDPSRPGDPDQLRKYADEAPKSIAASGGRYVVKGGAVQALEGDPPKGYIVVIGFDSVAKAREWYNSPTYEALRPIRQGSTKSRLLLVEGVAPD